MPLLLKRAAARCHYSVFHTRHCFARPYTELPCHWYWLFLEYFQHFILIFSAFLFWYCRCCCRRRRHGESFHAEPLPHITWLYRTWYWCHYDDDDIMMMMMSFRRRRRLWYDISRYCRHAKRPPSRYGCCRHIFTMFEPIIAFRCFSSFHYWHCRD